MKVLLIQENGRHDKNRNFRECFSLQRAFNFHGYISTVWGLGHSNFNDKIDFNEFDIIFNLENYGDNWLPDLSKFNKPKKILWSIDAHCRGCNAYDEIFNKGKYDILLHSTKDYVKESFHHWFPNCYDDTLIYPLNMEKDITLGFCGNYANRKDMLTKLQKECGLRLDIFTIGHDMVKIINRYKCHFNKNIYNDINYRSFETIGCNTLLLTNNNYQYDELGFKHNINCLMYNNMDECIHYMKHLNEYNINTISENGFKLAKLHTYNIRIKQLIEKGIV